MVALPSVTVLDLLARFALRKRLHRLRMDGRCMRKVVVVGHGAVIAELAAMLRRETYHGLALVAACVAGLPPGEAPAELSETSEHDSADDRRDR